MSHTITINNITIANPWEGSDPSYYNGSTLFAIGEHGHAGLVLVYHRGSTDTCDLDSAIETALDAIPHESWDITDLVNEVYDEALADGESEEDAWETATADAFAFNGGQKYASDPHIIRKDWHGIDESAFRDACKQWAEANT